MTIEELREEANKLGYKVVPMGRPRPTTALYDKCKDCVYLTGEVRSIGIECKHPTKQFRTEYSQFKSPSSKACKLFIKKEEE